MKNIYRVRVKSRAYIPYPKGIGVLRPSNKKPYHIAWNTFYPDDLITKGDGFVIHHIDKNPCNNIKENLKKMTIKEHLSLHHKGKEIPHKMRKQISSTLKKKYKNKLHFNNGRIFSKEHRRKLSESHLGKPSNRKGTSCSEKTKKILSDINKGKKHSIQTRIKMKKAQMKRRKEEKEEAFNHV